jgi:hypothetical protein
LRGAPAERRTIRQHHHRLGERVWQSSATRGGA